MDSYVDRAEIDEVIKVFKIYAEKSIEMAKTAFNEQVNGKKKKVNLLSVDEAEDKTMALAGFNKNDKMYLQLTFKLPPLNRTTYINNYRPLPHPYLPLIDPTICLIVIDRNHQPLPDRELDLRMTKEFYQKRLLDAGISEDIIKHRLLILPMRELLTEYRMPAMKRRLAASYDIILADGRLISDRFKLLPKFLGHKFWIEKKIFPIGVDLKFKGSTLKNSFNRALRTSSLYITGHGPDSSVSFGIFRQSEKELADNLEFICKCIYKTYGQSIQLLRIKSTKSLAIPFYADLNRPTEMDKKLIPRTDPLNSNPVEDDHPFFENAKLIVYPTGKTLLKRPEGWTPGSDDEEEEDSYKHTYDDNDQDVMKAKGYSMNIKKRFRTNSKSKSNSNSKLKPKFSPKPKSNSKPKPKKLKL